MNSSTSTAEEIIEIAKRKLGKFSEKIVSTGTQFEPESLKELGEDITDWWIVVFELDIPIDPGFAILYVHDKTHEIIIMSTL